MRFLILFICVAVMNGCTIIVKPRFPEAPQELQVECDPLKEMNENTLTNLLTVVNENYSSYKICSERVRLWNIWFKEHQTIYKGIFK